MPLGQPTPSGSGSHATLVNDAALLNQLYADPNFQGEWTEAAALYWCACQLDWTKPVIHLPATSNDADWMANPTTLRQLALAVLVANLQGQPARADELIAKANQQILLISNQNEEDTLAKGILSMGLLYQAIRMQHWQTVFAHADDVSRWFSLAFPIANTHEQQLASRLMAHSLWQKLYADEALNHRSPLNCSLNRFNHLFKLNGVWLRCPSSFPVLSLLNHGLRIATVGKNPKQLMSRLKACHSDLPGFSPIVEALLAQTSIAGSHDENQAWLTEWVNRFPHRWEGYAQLGELSLESDNTDQALLHFQRAISLAPKEGHLHYQLGVLYTQLGQPEIATEPLKLALATVTDGRQQAECCHLLGQCYLTIDPDNRMDLAEHLLTQACELNPDESRYAYVLAIWLFHQGRYAEAEKYYRELIARTPGDAMLTCSLGYLRWLQGDIQAASELYQQAITIDEHYDVAYNNLGVLYLEHWQDAEMALELFDKAVSCNGDYAVAHYNLGRAYRAKGQRFEAAASFQWARELSGHSHELDDAYLKSELNQLFKAS